MRKILFPILLFGLFSCSKTSVEETPIVINKDYPFTELTVDVDKDKAVIVYNGVDTLAVLTEPSTIEVPKFSEITFEEIDNSNNNLGEKYQTWQVIAFEDSRNADFDYNDLVIHTKILQHKNNTQISVHPIALGSTKKIKLGVTIDNKDYILSDNVRKDLFKSIVGFINTDVRMKRHKFDKFAIHNYPTTRSTMGKSINWFIEVDNKLRLYAVSKYDFTDNRPYGLIFNNINEPYKYNKDVCGLDWFNYPMEGVAIENVYPLFFNKDLSFKEIYSNSVSGYYPAIIADENRVASDDCLYAIK